MGSFKRIFKRVLNPGYSSYIKELKRPLIEDRCLFEAGQGKNVNGNMFALLRELLTRPEFKGFKAVWVVVPETEARATALFDEYGLKADFVERDSDRYKSELARCKFLFTDNSFPTYMVKREGQVCVNTWHGTPLKCLGLSDIDNSLKSFANIQKNYLMSDYALFPNDFVRDVFLDDYQLRKLYSGELVMLDYPRNGIFRDVERASKIRSDSGYGPEHQLIAYMPTWRGAGRMAEEQEQIVRIEAHLSEIDQGLDDGQTFFVNLHFLVSDKIDYSKYRHVRPFPVSLETYDFLAICDCLVSDYSSVIFDYAATGKPIVLFTYDLDEYEKDRGLYVSVDELPFPKSTDTKDLLERLKRPELGSYSAFQAQYCSYQSKFPAFDLLNLAIKGDRGSVVLEKCEPFESPHIFYSSSMSNGLITDVCLDYAKSHMVEDGVVVFVGRNKPETVEGVKKAAAIAPILALPSNRVLSRFERVVQALSSRCVVAEKLLSGCSEKFETREMKRLLYGISPGGITILNSGISYFQKIAKRANCAKYAVVRGTLFSGAKNQRREAICRRGYSSIYQSESHIRSLVGCDRRGGYYSRGLGCTILSKHVGYGNDRIVLKGLARLWLPGGVSGNNVAIQTPEGFPVGSFAVLCSVNGGCLARYKIEIARDDFLSFPIHSLLGLHYEDEEGYSGDCPILFNYYDGGRSDSRVAGLTILEDCGTSVYFRQAAKNRLCFTVRDTVSIDSRKQRVKIRMAYLLSLVPLPRRKILLFEKEASRYEESASVVYEKLIDEGHRDARFVLGDSSRSFEGIETKYRKGIVLKNSLAHYYLFFTAKTFIGTEAIAHSIDLRPANRLVSRRLRSRKMNYVFLQHGVMYMLSLDSESRTFFKPKKLDGKYRVVTSSNAEKAHFVDLGGYDPGMLYVCGLPKFDRNRWHKDASKILIMPTWRPWEYNLAREDFTATGYYSLAMDMFNSVPNSLRDQVVFCPHPLFADAASKGDFPLRGYMETDLSYDDILKDTKLLITDYSSIAYDAFYRGANVLFYWRDKDRCMAEYGPSSHLMIDEESAFGKVCYDRDELEVAFEENYHSGQVSSNVDRYRRIVEFHDGKNTDRLFALLKADRII